MFVHMYPPKMDGAQKRTQTQRETIRGNLHDKKYDLDQCDRQPVVGDKFLVVNRKIWILVGHFILTTLQRVHVVQS